MTCTKCNKPMLKCRCPDAIERIKWLLSSDSPVVFDEDTFRALRRRKRELEGERELNGILP